MLIESPVSLSELRRRAHQLLEPALEQCIPVEPRAAARLHEAVGYSILGGGKRIRPLLVFAACEDFGGDPTRALPAALAVELVHGYSLIHDDLPAMDNDDYRRGKPTCHRAYDQATAILAGDGLQALAFEQIAVASSLPPATRIQLLSLLAEASGNRGMVAGQAIDLAAVGRQLNLAELEEMHALKTGALIQFSILAGAMVAKERLDSDDRRELQHFGKALGLAFQIRDDILDVEANRETLGKSAGKDAAAGKPTYTSMMGLDGARHHLSRQLETAEATLRRLGLESGYLQALTSYVGNRQY